MDVVGRKGFPQCQLSSESDRYPRRIPPFCAACPPPGKKPEIYPVRGPLASRPSRGSCSTCSAANGSRRNPQASPAEDGRNLGVQIPTWPKRRPFACPEHFPVECSSRFILSADLSRLVPPAGPSRRVRPQTVLDAVWELLLEKMGEIWASRSRRGPSGVRLRACNVFKLSGVSLNKQSPDLCSSILCSPAASRAGIRAASFGHVNSPFQDASREPSIVQIRRNWRNLWRFKDVLLCSAVFLCEPCVFFCSAMMNPPWAIWYHGT